MTRESQADVRCMTMPRRWAAPRPVTSDSHFCCTAGRSNRRSLTDRVQVELPRSEWDLLCPSARWVQRMSSGMGLRKGSFRQIGIPDQQQAFVWDRQQQKEQPWRRTF